jgi:probable addiction module antidote protein
MKKNHESLDTYLIGQLEDEGFRERYLMECLLDNDPNVFLYGLRLAIKASDKTVTELADLAGMNRVSLYRALSETGNPGWINIREILRGLGYELGIRKLPTPKQRRA